MSFDAMAWASRALPETTHQKLVLMMLASHQNAQTGLCNPSIRTLALECVCSPTAVKDALAGLERLGLIQHHSGRHTGRSNSYRLCITRGQGSREATTPVATKRLGGSRQAATKQEIETVTFNLSNIEKIDHRQKTQQPVDNSPPDPEAKARAIAQLRGLSEKLKVQYR